MMNFIPRLAGLLLICTAAIVMAATPATMPPKKTASREVLPDNVIPVHYELALSPDAEALTFHAQVSITVDVRIETAAITLNAAGLDFDHAAVDGDKQGTVERDEKLGRATVTVGAPLPRGRHVLSIDYHGKIGRSTLGF